MKLGVVIGDMRAFTIDGAIGVTANGVLAFAQKVLGDNRTILLVHHDFYAQVRHDLTGLTFFLLVYWGYFVHFNLRIFNQELDLARGDIDNPRIGQ